MENEKSAWRGMQKKINDMVSIGVTNNRLNQFYDIFSTLALVINLVAAFAATFEEVRAAHGELIEWVETITVFFFLIDYVLRIISAAEQYPDGFCRFPSY